jgi:hypothetical protein
MAAAPCALRAARSARRRLTQSSTWIAETTRVARPTSVANTPCIPPAWRRRTGPSIAHIDESRRLWRNPRDRAQRVRPWPVRGSGSVINERVTIHVHGVRSSSFLRPVQRARLDPFRRMFLDRSSRAVPRAHTGRTIFSRTRQTTRNCSARAGVSSATDNPSTASHRLSRPTTSTRSRTDLDE